MTDPVFRQPTISDPDFRRAVELLDAGEATEFRHWLESRPHLLNAVATGDDLFSNGYFEQPKLLWFVAENPIRKGRLPANITELASVLIEVANKHPVDDLGAQLDYTLALVASGRIARECGVQKPLIQTLVAAGANPNAGLRSALGHREIDACEALLEQGAEMSLSLAAGLNREADINRLKRGASDQQMQEALAVASINGRALASRILLDNGADPNRYNPDKLHAHTTPLHQAIDIGSLETVCTLVTRGADPTIKDQAFGSDARGWATHLGRNEIVEFLDLAEAMMPAVRAVREGDVDQLRQWLQAHADKVNDTLGDNPRTLLHYATDWPGFWPRCGESIACLVAAGANVDAKCVGPEDSPSETPLHWAASSDDVDAAAALITAGADLNVTGGCIANGTPLLLAVIFGKWRVAAQLVEAGAAIALPLVAGMGRMDLVETYFDHGGKFRNPYSGPTDYDSLVDAQQELNGAICLAARGGRMEIARYLLDRGAMVNMQSPVNTTPLDEAINNGHDALAEFLRSRGAQRAEELERD